MNKQWDNERPFLEVPVVIGIIRSHISYNDSWRKVWECLYNLKRRMAYKRKRNES